MADADQPTVMIVDDDPQVTGLYADVLSEEYRVVIANSGEHALELVDEAVDVMLLDRRMAGLSGDDTLQQIRDDGHEFPVAMVTAVEPAFDVVELGFDDYVVKPIWGVELLDLVESLLLRNEYDAVMREYFSLVSKVLALHSRATDGSSDDGAEFARVEERIAEMKRHAFLALEEAIESGKFEDLFRESAMNEWMDDDSMDDDSMDIIF